MAFDKVGLSAGSIGFRDPASAAARAGATRGASPQAGGSGAAQAGTSIDGAGLRGRVDLIQASIRAEGLQRLGDHAHRVESALAETHGLLEEIRGLIQDQRETGTINGSALDAARARLATIAESISRAEARASGEADAAGAVDVVTLTSGLAPLDIQRGFVIANVDPGVGKVNGRSTLPPGSVRDVELEVVTSAVSANLGLSFDGSQLDLDTPQSVFTIEISGALGSRELSFASGTSLHSVAAAINYFASVTGVAAKVDSLGKSIDLTAPPEDGAFVSLKVLESGGARGFIFDDQDYILDRLARATPDEEFHDDSTSFHATIAGEPVTLNGNTISSNTDEWSLRIDLDLAQFNHAGTHHLFLLFATSDGSLQPQDAPPEFTEATAVGANAVREANEVAQDAGVSVERIDLARADVADRRRSILELIRGPLADARASSRAILDGLVRTGPKSGWRVDTRG